MDIGVHSGHQVDFRLSGLCRLEIGFWVLIIVFCIIENHIWNRFKSSTITRSNKFPIIGYVLNTSTHGCSCYLPFTVHSFTCSFAKLVWLVMGLQIQHHAVFIIIIIIVSEDLYWVEHFASFFMTMDCRLPFFLKQKL